MLLQTHGNLEIEKMTKSIEQGGPESWLVQDTSEDSKNDQSNEKPEKLESDVSDEGSKLYQQIQSIFVP